MGNFERMRSSNNFKMDTKLLLPLFAAVIALATPASSEDPRVVCYYTNWSVYRPGTAKFNPQNINPYLCTHLIYAFGGFTKENTLKPFDKYQDIEKGGYAKFTGLKTYNKNLKTLLAIGGWNEGSTRFSPMVASRERRKEFVRNAIKFLRQNRFDGLDLDWEYPAFRDGGKPKDRENYAKLVKELREEFEREAEKTGKPRLLLTMAVPAGIEYIQKGFDVETLNRYLDWMNLLSYDYHSAFEPAVNHHAPLYPLEEPNEYSVDNELNIDYTIKFYLESGADRNKIVLGIPTYGRSYTLFNSDAVEIGSPADGPGEQGEATREKGYLAYYEICDALKPKTKKRSVYSDEDSEEYSEEEEEEPWTVAHPNPDAMGPVAYKGNQWVGYDDVDIVKKKGEYAAENGLGGIMFWSIDNDDFRGTCHDKPFPLIEAAKEAYYKKVATVDETAIQTVTRKPQSSSKGSSNRRKNRPRTSTTTTTTTTTTPKPATKNNKRNKGGVTSSTPSWNLTPEPPTTPDPGTDFKCEDEGFYPHPRDCKKYFWCLDSGPSNLGIVAHQFTCPSGLYFNKAADSCDFARNVLCKKPASTTKAPTTKPSTTTVTTTTTTTTTTRRPVRVSTRNSILFRTSTTSTTPEPETEEEYEEDVSDDSAAPSDTDAEDPKVIKELIDLIKKVGGIEQLEKQLRLGEAPVSTNGGITTTQSSFNKKLYQKVLERTRGKNKIGGNSILDSLTQNSRRGPQSEGLEPTADRDKLLKKDRPQYTTINRQRTSTTTEEPLESDETDNEADEPTEQILKSRGVESELTVATTAKPLQYVNIRRARPTSSTSDTADDSASRNALFERPETYISVSDSPNTLDIASARRENVPEYVTIRRQRPATEQTTTLQYDNSEDEERETERGTALEREISSQPQYTSIVRTRSTTIPPTEQPSTPKPVVIRTRPTTSAPEKPNSPEPTTVLAVQISSFLNSLTSDNESPEQPTTISEAPETTTTTMTAAPSSSPTRRTILRRRGPSSSTSSPSTASSSTQVSQRNYAFVRRRPTRPNEISDSDIELSRKIRSTTPDSREVNNVKPIRETGRRFTSRFRSQNTNDDSIPAAASQISRDQLRPQISPDEVLSLTPVDIEPQFIPRQGFTPRNERQFRGRTTPSDTISDSEVSAAEVRRPTIVPRGRSRFNPSSTVESSTQAINSGSTAAPRRPTFARFNPRPFARNSVSTTEANNQEQVSSQRIATRFQFGRTRPTTASVLQARKIPFQSRIISTQKPIEDDNDEPESKTSEDITLSESERQEKEHDEDVNSDDFESSTKASNVQTFDFDDLDLSDNYDDGEESKTKDIQTTTPNSELAKRRFRVIRRRPTSTTTVPNIQSSSVVPSSTPTRVRKIILRKKLRPVNEQEIIEQSVASFNAVKETTTTTTTTEVILNYGEKSRAIVTTSTTNSPSTILEQVIPTENNYVQINEDLVIESRIKPDVESPTENQDTPIPISKLEEPIKESVQKEDSDITKEVSNKEEIEEKSIETTTIALVEQSSQTAITDVKTIQEINDEDNKEVESQDTLTTETSITETEESQSESTTTSTTQPPSSVRTRPPYRPQKRIFTSTTQSSLPSSSKVFSRKYNPGAYTSPSTVTREPFKPSTTRRPVSSRLFTRKPSTTARTTQKAEEEYSDEEFLDEEPEEDPLVLVPINQLFTRKPDSEENNDTNDNPDEILEEEEDTSEEEPLNSFTATTKKPGFKPRVINSNTFRTSTSTTELPKSLNNNNRTGIFTRFSSNKPVNDTKKRVQNVPVGYNIPVLESKPNLTIGLENQTLQTAEQDTSEPPTNTSSVPQKEGETTDTPDADDYLSVTEPLNTTISDYSSTSRSTNTIEIENYTSQMEIDNSTNDYLEQTEGTTNIPTTLLTSTNVQPITELESTVSQAIPTTTTITTTEPALEVPETTSQAPVTPIVKTQFDKLFSVSRVVEVSSKQDKHRLNKNNETTLIEEGQIKVEKKPMIDQIGEVSRFSLIKIFEDEIPIYLTKLGHVYPVDNPPDNPIRIDEARNARALVSFLETPKENLVASESINEAYRHVKRDYDKDSLKDPVEHLPNDDFLSFINDEKVTDKPQGEQLFAHWQFIPAAYENEQNKAKLEIVTPRSMLTNPSTLPLEGLFKTEKPFMARKVSEGNQPFVVYSASVPTQKEMANIVQVSVLKPETGRSIVTFAKGQEFKGSSVEETTVKPLVSVSILSSTELTSTSSTSTTTSTTKTTTTSTTTEKPSTSPLVELLSSTSALSSTTTSSTTTEAPITTETVTEGIITTKSSPLETKRNKFPFARRPILKPSNFTKPSPTPRVSKKLNSTSSPNIIQKSNKTVSFSPKARLSGSRVQNIPVDFRKKPGSQKTTKTYTTEAPRTTTERKVLIKQFRPGFQRPAFVPRKLTTPSTVGDT